MNDDNYSVELGNRVIAAMYEENNGIKYKRQHAVADRAMEALFSAAEKPVVLCEFSNKHGLCKLDKGHTGSHTVIDLGNDD